MQLGGRFPSPPGGARLRAPPPPGAQREMYGFTNGFQRIPVGAPSRPPGRRGPRPAPSRAAVEAGKSVSHVNRFTCDTLFASIFHGFCCFLARRPGSCGLRRLSGEPLESIGKRNAFYESRSAAVESAGACRRTSPESHLAARDLPEVDIHGILTDSLDCVHMAYQ